MSGFRLYPCDYSLSIIGKRGRGGYLEIGCLGLGMGHYCMVYKKFANIKEKENNKTIINNYVINDIGEIISDYAFNDEYKWSHSDGFTYTALTDFPIKGSWYPELNVLNGIPHEKGIVEIKEFIEYEKQGCFLDECSTCNKSKYVYP